MTRKQDYRRLALESMETRVCLDGAACADGVIDQQFVRRETDDGMVLVRDQTVDPCHSESVERASADPVGADVQISTGIDQASASTIMTIQVTPPPASGPTIGTLIGPAIGVAVADGSG